MIRTGGGVFDPDADRWCMFLAGDPQQAHRRYHLTATNDAFTTADERASIVEPLDRGAKLLLDSGIFHLTNAHKRATGCAMDEALTVPPEQLDGFDGLYRRYVGLVRRHEPQLWGYSELDQGGPEHKRATRQRLHDEGLNPIPVYHPLSDGWDYFDELAESYDRICWGNVVHAKPAMRVRLLHTMWERRRRYPHLWIHVLGLTASELSAAIPSDSCDSSTWCGGLRWSNTDLAASYLHRGVVGSLGRGAMYHRDVDRFDAGGWMQAATAYAQAYDHLTDEWRQLAADRGRLGFDAWPTPHPEESAPCPSAPAQP